MEEGGWKYKNYKSGEWLRHFFFFWQLEGGVGGLQSPYKDAHIVVQQSF